MGKRLPCKLDGCAKPSAGQGLCQKHYLAWKKENWGPCLINYCDRTAWVRGICQSHYQKMRHLKLLDLFPSAHPNKNTECAEQDCSEGVEQFARCADHALVLMEKASEFYEADAEWLYESLTRGNDFGGNGTIKCEACGRPYAEHDLSERCGAFLAQPRSGATVGITASNGRKVKARSG